jgi:LPXTG-site transpeptidase (sortase) family protein
VAKVTRKTTNKRQPAKTRLPSSRSKKPSVKTTKKKPAVRKKTSVRKSTKPAAKTSKKTAPVKSPAKRTQPKARKLSIRIGRRTSLVLSFKLAKKATPKKLKKSTKKKQEPTLEKNLLVSFTLCAIGAFGINQSGEHIFSAPLSPDTSYSNNQDLSDEGASKKYLPESMPTHLSIPSIDMDTNLTQVGKNPDGTMEVPADHHVAGWYRYSPTPGERGPAVITGHVNSYKGPSVFANLSQLKNGQVIKIKREDGKVAKFKVVAVKQFPQNSFPTEEVYGDIKHAGLRLITCSGNFNYLTRQYSDNTVVFASYIEE